MKYEIINKKWIKKTHDFNEQTFTSMLKITSINKVTFSTNPHMPSNSIYPDAKFKIDLFVTSSLSLSLFYLKDEEDQYHKDCKDLETIILLAKE